MSTATPSVDIIIPHFGVTPDLTAYAVRCLESIATHSRDYRVIFIDNGSPDDSYLPTLRQLPHMLIRNRHNLGFVKATNQGLAFSTAPHVVLMNNDTQAVPNWLEKLREAFDADAAVGIAGPFTNSLKCWQGRAYAEMRCSFPDPTTIEYDLSTVVLPPGRMLAFFCAMISRRCLDAVGLLDEDFGVGFGDDDNYCLRAERAGFRLALVRSLMIPHAHRTTFSEVYGAEAIPAMQEKALELFHQKRRGER
jgi:GT2 family glycosyltransferase